MKEITKKAVVAMAPATTKKQATVKAPIVTKKAIVAVKTPVAKAKTDFVTIVKTKYGYYRYWVRAIMAEAAVMKYRFIKNSDSYDGVLAVAKEEADKARKALVAYTKQNPTTVSMWEF
jgi:hypothetical protein